MKSFIILIIITISFLRVSSQVDIQCDNVEPAKYLLPEVSYVDAIEKRVEDKIEACEIHLREDEIIATRIHPFVESVHYAYAQHRPLVISPDMVWLLICQGFSKHIDYHGEELRDKFVNFQDKKELIIATESLSMNFHKGSPNSPWKLAFPVFSDSIKTYIGEEIHGIFVQSFSTTTFMETAAYEVTLMDGMESYFEYVMTTSCGIPTITLEGNINDWIKIKESLVKLKGYKIDDWVESLEPIIQEFINANNNNVNHDFWSEIYKRRGGSGGPHITGWIIKFFPYLKTIGKGFNKNPYLTKKPTGNFSGLNTSDFYNGLSKVDVKWNYHGTKYEMEFLAGFIGIRQDHNSKKLTPEIGWTVKEKKQK